MTSTLAPVDVASEPFLSGRFAPTREEVTADRLRVVSGSVPSDMTGAYLRNGPNPEFTPLGSYTYPLEGDGMIHGVWFADGTARYANRYVRTQGLRAEERAGRALFGGLMTPVLVDQSLLGPDPDPGWPFKLDPFINVVRHGDHVLALAEGDQPYEIAADLETIGRHEFGGGLPGMCAHPKIDPITGEMIVFRYDIEAPFLTWSVIGPTGTVSRPPVAVEDVDESYMIHDFAITEHHLLLVVAPLQLDVNAMFAGGDPLVWKPELGTRIAVINRDGTSPTRWVHGDAFWAWHYANAFEESGRINLDFPWTTAPTMVLPPSQRSATGAGFTRAVIDPTAGRFELHHLDDLGNEFPRIDDRLTGRRHRYLTVAGRSGHAGLRSGEHDVLGRYDMDAGTSIRVATGAAIGEVSFAPRDGGTDELDGYYVAFGTDLDTDRSALYIWDAADPAAGAVAIIETPHRVPNGLHGNWLPNETGTTG